MKTSTKRTIEKYGADCCRLAYKLNSKDGEGPSNIGFCLGLTTMQANAAINAGRELANTEPAKGRTTLRKVNAALDAKYGAGQLELVRGKGYFWFDGDLSAEMTDGYGMRTSSVYVFHLSAYTVEDWLEQAEELLKEYREQQEAVRRETDAADKRSSLKYCF